MKLNKELVVNGNFSAGIKLPASELFALPEKILQFGTGVLLRGLPDYFIDKANKQNVFNGRIVVVKSTDGNADEFAAQSFLYTHCIKGISEGKIVEEYSINASISNVLSAKKDWQKILQYADNEEMKIIISNTTEVGIVMKSDDDINAMPPQSFPAKLLAILYRRYKHFNGSEKSGMVIIPTELIVDNGTKLKSIVLALANIHTPDEMFINWLNTANDFCNSLVDRIVPGSLKKQELDYLEENFEYNDELGIMSEPYSLWAIESASEKTKNILSFYKADDSVVITPDINKYRELKLRLLNGTHTFSCGLAYLAGFNLVNEAMQNASFARFIKELMFKEIVPLVTNASITNEEAISFANNVIERFRNPFIEHKWLSITLHYSAKMKMRNVPLLFAWYEKMKTVPMHMAAGFAAFILFSKPVIKEEGEVYYGLRNGEKYKIDDANASYFYNLWQQYRAEEVIDIILENKNLWDADLTSLQGFAVAVKDFFNQFTKEEFKYVITRLSQGGKIANEV